MVFVAPSRKTHFRSAVGGVHSHQEDAMKRAVRTRDGASVPNQALDHAAHSSQGRASIGNVCGNHPL
jgi:hypothetical protein